MLLKRLFVFFVLVTSSCTSGSTRVDSAAGTRGAAQAVDDILAERNYTVEFSYEGCFGGGSETLEVRDKKIAIYTFPVFGEADKVKEKVDTLPWTREKEVALRGLFIAGIQSRDTLGSCTTTANYKLMNSSKFVTFSDRDCALSGAMERLLK